MWHLNGSVDTRIILICTQLLIIHFEDGTFQVLPCLVSIKAKEVSLLTLKTTGIKAGRMKKCAHLTILPQEGKSTVSNRPFYSCRLSDLASELQRDWS